MVELVSQALAGGWILSTVPPGKSRNISDLKKNVNFTILGLNLWSREFDSPLPPLGAGSILSGETRSECLAMQEKNESLKREKKLPSSPFL